MTVGYKSVTYDSASVSLVGLLARRFFAYFEGERREYVEESGHSEAEIIAALKQVDAGRKVEDVAREVGVVAH